MAISELTSRDAVLEAIEEWDRIGRDAFLERYRFGPSRRYFVRYRGRPYDSKALSGVAYGKQFRDRGPLRSTDFSGGMQTSVATLRRLGFEVVSGAWRPTTHFYEGRTYSWEELGDHFGFAPDYLNRVGGMVPRPNHDAVLLITHPQGGKSFDYDDYWDGADLIYTGRGLSGHQKLEGANLDVAENRRQLLLFEHAGPRDLLYLGEVTCAEYWETMAPDRSGRDRRIYRFRLRLSRPVRRPSRARRRGGTSGQRGQRPSASFHSRDFDPNRPAPSRRPGQVRDPEQQRVLAEQANQGHQDTLRTFGLWLEANGWRDLKEVDGATGLMGRRRDRGRARRVLFEIKTVTRASERSRVRSGLAQLLEYKYFLGEDADLLCLVTNRPIGDRRLQLLNSLGIGHASVEGGDVRVSGTRASRRIFGPAATGG